MEEKKVEFLEMTCSRCGKTSRIKFTPDEDGDYWGVCLECINPETGEHVDMLLPKDKMQRLLKERASKP
jgi:hypothetical protein